MSEIEDQVNEAIANAINTEIKAKYGEDVLRRNTIVLTLIEWPRQEGDGPGTPRIQLSVKTLEPIATTAAGKMLERASIQFQRAAVDAEKEA